MSNPEESNELIKVDSQDKSLISYIPSPFVVASLPTRAVKNVPFVRKFNNITMTLNGVGQIPYGKNGRLLLSIFTTYAVISKNVDDKNNVIINYRSIKELLDELGLPTSRTTEIKEQLEYFSKSNFVFEQKITQVVEKKYAANLFGDLEEVPQQIPVDITSTGIIPFFSGAVKIETVDTNKKSCAFSIILAPQFTQYCREHSVPINYTVYKEISSALGKDLYVWLTYRNNALIESNNKDGVFIPYDALVNQFMPVGEDSGRTQVRTNYDYIKELIINIKNNYYKDLNINFRSDGTGIDLFPSKPQILDNDKRYVLLTSDMKV